MMISVTVSGGTTAANVPDAGLALFLWTVFCCAAAGQSVRPASETAQLVRHGSYATLSVETHRPLDAIATALGVSAEDPFYIFDGDMMDASLETPRLKPGTRVPKRHKLEIEFAVNADGSPKNLGELLRRIASQYNAKTPFAYRVEDDGGYFFVPARTRDAHGRIVEMTPLLDRRVTIPLGTRPVMESAYLMAQDLSRQTGLTVSCCQSATTGIPWGMDTHTFEAKDEPARSVLKRLGLMRWHSRRHQSYCFIDAR